MGHLNAGILRLHDYDGFLGGMVPFNNCTLACDTRISVNLAGASHGFLHELPSGAEEASAPINRTFSESTTHNALARLLVSAMEAAMHSAAAIYTHCAEIETDKRRSFL
jgi:hypothetical protein